MQTKFDVSFRKCPPPDRAFAPPARTPFRRTRPRQRKLELRASDRGLAERRAPPGIDTRCCGLSELDNLRLPILSPCLPYPKRRRFPCGGCCRARRNVARRRLPNRNCRDGLANAGLVDGHARPSPALDTDGLPRRQIPSSDAADLVHFALTSLRIVSSTMFSTSFRPTCFGSGLRTCRYSTVLAVFVACLVRLAVVRLLVQGPAHAAVDAIGDVDRVDRRGAASSRNVGQGFSTSARRDGGRVSSANSAERLSIATVPASVNAMTTASTAWWRWSSRFFSSVAAVGQYGVQSPLVAEVGGDPPALTCTRRRPSASICRRRAARDTRWPAATCSGCPGASGRQNPRPASAAGTSAVWRAPPNRENASRGQ